MSEAHRIRLAHLFDTVLAVHTSVVEPLPHQITAVYEVMLSRQPLCFLLADDPGAGKTIMVGLLPSPVRRCPVLVDRRGATWAEIREEALANLEEVVKLIVASMVEHVNRLQRRRRRARSGYRSSPCWRSPSERCPLFTGRSGTLRQGR